MTTPPIPTPPPPSQNIGPFYQGLGAVCLLAALSVVGLLVWRGATVNIPEAVLLGLPFVMGLALLRPPLFDALVRLVATKLPFTKYGDPDAHT